MRFVYQTIRLYLILDPCGHFTTPRDRENLSVKNLSFDPAKSFIFDEVTARKIWKPFWIQNSRINRQNYPPTFLWLKEVGFAKLLAKRSCGQRLWTFLRYILGFNYTTLCVQVRLVRKLSIFLITMYLPSISLVALSWVGFWIDKRAVPARASLTITTILAQITLITGTANQWV